MAAFFGLFKPKCLIAQATSQILQPEHSSGMTANLSGIRLTLLEILWDYYITIDYSAWLFNYRNQSDSDCHCLKVHKKQNETFGCDVSKKIVLSPIIEL
jgi:hypothetical protein